MRLSPLTTASNYAIQVIINTTVKIQILKSNALPKIILVNYTNPHISYECWFQINVGLLLFFFYLEGDHEIYGI